MRYFHTLGRVLLTLTAATGCVSGTPTNTPLNTGIEGIVGNASGGGTSGGTGGGRSIVSSYKLASVGGTALPVLLIDDSVVATDSTHIFRAHLDSSLISLNSDTTATETNFLSLFETRIGAGLSSDSVFVNDSIIVADTAQGTYIYNSTAANVSLALTDTINNQPTANYLVLSVSGDTLSAYIGYTVFDLNGIPRQAPSELFVYTVSGASERGGFTKSPIAATQSAPTPARSVRITARRQVLTLPSARPPA